MIGIYIRKKIKDTLLLTAPLRLVLALEDGEGYGRVMWWGVMAEA